MGSVAEDGGGFSGKNGEHHIVDDAGDVDVDGVCVSVNEGEPIVSDNPKDSSTSTTISPSTQAAIDALIKDLGKDATNARPLYSYDTKNITSSQYLLTDSQLSTEIPITEIDVKTDAVTPAHRNRMPSIWIQAPYCTSFGSSKKGKEKLKNMARLHFPFEGCGIADKVSPKLIKDYMNWLLRGLLKNHNNKNPSDDKYRSRSSSFGFTMMDFVVAFPMNKNWFYAMSQPNKCWSDEHIDVIFYYLRKKSKLCSMDQYRYTTTHCLFMSHVKNCYDRYYMDDDDDSLTTQEHIDRTSVVSVHERLIRVFDSSISTRKQTIPHEIKMLSKMLPSYLLDSGFFEENERTKFANCQAYKDNNNGSLLEPQVPFMIKFAQDIPTQESDSLDCRLYVTAFADYISDQINISYADFNPDYLRQRYGVLLWSYGSEKAKCGYVSDNDDPPKFRGVVTPPP
ncbi:uncharacterized protein [Solanum lycopersicum]|uniref:uncharacterized protein n=1 Tax=Solanum lycopersicum TaxID=4081 RepID=UPI00374A2E57